MVMVSPGSGDSHGENATGLAGWSGREAWHLPWGIIADDGSEARSCFSGTPGWFVVARFIARLRKTTGDESPYYQPMPGAMLAALTEHGSSAPPITPSPVVSAW